MNNLANSLISEWFEREPERHRSRIGIPNTALHVLEIFRRHWPLREAQFLTSGGGQVAGLSGVSGDAIVARYNASLRSMGTEAGRTSRSTPAAAHRLAERLNELSRQQASEPRQRAALADAMQRWLVEEVLAQQLIRDEKRLLILRTTEPLEHALNRYFEELADSSWRQAATRLLVAVIESVIQVRTLTLDRPSPKPTENTFSLGDISIVVSEIPTFADMETCEDILTMGKRCLLLTSEHRSLASAQLLEAAGLNLVEVDSATRFIARIIDVASGFEAHGREELMEKINKRLLAAGNLI